MPDDTSSAASIRVLLADDHDILRQDLKMLLSMHQEMQVVGEARTGREAIVLTKEIKPDVIVMDITMPDMDGLEACQLIRSQQPATQGTDAHHARKRGVFSKSAACGCRRIPCEESGAI